MDHIQSNTSDKKVSVFATTNMPWELDIAALRRVYRKILVPMPSVSIRTDIFKLHSGDHHLLELHDFDELGEMTHGYTGSDISTVVNEALMRPLK
jgi:vacuolar protein-sorting-associated protein 4